MPNTLILQKVAYILASGCEGDWFSYLFSVWRKTSYNLEKNEKTLRTFSLFARENPERKNVDVTFSLKRSVHKHR